MTHRFRAAVGALALAGAAGFGAGNAQAQIINLFGDLGTGTTLGTPFSPINSTFTQSFTQTAAAGTITGDVIVTNDPTGTIFTMTITNLAYTCTVANAAGTGDVIVVVDHTYITSGFGTYVGTQSLSGSWTSGPNSLVQLDSIHDFTASNVSLPTLLATTSPFALGPVSATATTTGLIYQIRTILRLQTDGLGTITLPTSAHITATLVPGPTGAAALGLLGVAASARRRRS